MVNTRCLLAATLAITLNIGARSVAAQVTESVTARVLFEEARKAANVGNYALACPKFLVSYRLDPAVGTLLNIATCQQWQGQLATAWVSFHKALDRMAPDDDRRAAVVAVVAGLEKRLPRLLLRLPSTAPADSVIEHDGKPFLARNLGVALPVNPGRHDIVVKSKGRLGRNYEIVVLEGETKEQTVSPGSTIGTLDTRSVANRSSSSARAKSKPPQRSRLPQYVTGGVGAMGLVTGLITRIAAFQQKPTIDSHCNDAKTCDSKGLDAVSKAKTYQTVSTVSLIVGATNIGACLYFVVSSSGKPERRVAIAPAFTNSAIGLTFAHSY